MFLPNQMKPTKTKVFECKGEEKKIQFGQLGEGSTFLHTSTLWQKTGYWTTQHNAVAIGYAEEVCFGEDCMVIPVDIQVICTPS